MAELVPTGPSDAKYGLVCFGKLNAVCCAGRYFALLTNVVSDAALVPRRPTTICLAQLTISALSARSETWQPARIASH